jgi:hypothetical protein
VRALAAVRIAQVTLPRTTPSRRSTVRTLQATLPGQISGDNPTNIFFFFHPAGDNPAP